MDMSLSLSIYIYIYIRCSRRAGRRCWTSRGRSAKSSRTGPPRTGSEGPLRRRAASPRTYHIIHMSIFRFRFRSISISISILIYLSIYLSIYLCRDGGQTRDGWMSQANAGLDLPRHGKRDEPNAGATICRSTFWVSPIGRLAGQLAGQLEGLQDSQMLYR